METDKTKTEIKETYKNVYQQYYEWNDEWRIWQGYIKQVIIANGANCDYIKSLLSELEKYMLESPMGKKWYGAVCPDLMKNELKTTLFLFWWSKRYHGEKQPKDDTESKVEECNTFFFNYSKWQYLKSLFKEPEPQQIEIPKELQTDVTKIIFEKAELAGFIVKAGTGYKKNNITKAQLAYFLKRVYLPSNYSSERFPDKELSRLFGESRLGAAITALANNKEGKPRGNGIVDIIDSLFTD